MERPDQVSVRVLKYDGTEYRRWEGHIVDGARSTHRPRS